MDTRADSLPRTPNQINKTSLPPLRRHYSVLLELYDECVRQRRASSGLATDRARQITTHRRAASAQQKQAKKKIHTLTQSALAREQAKKSAVWAAGSGVCVGVTYKIWEAVGFPGGRSWEFFWQMPEIVAGITTLLSILFAAVYRATHPTHKD